MSPRVLSSWGEGIGKCIGTPGDEGSLGATVSISQSSGVSAWTVGPGPCLHTHPAGGCPPFSTHVPAQVVQGTSPASSLGRGRGDIWALPPRDRYKPACDCAVTRASLPLVILSHRSLHCPHRVTPTNFNLSPLHPMG